MTNIEITQNFIENLEKQEKNSDGHKHRWRKSYRCPFLLISI